MLRKESKLNTMVLTLFFCLMAPTANAGIITYDFAWSGANGYTMAGWFDYDDVNAGDGAIRDGEVNSLMFEGFLNGVSVGVSNGANLLAGFNFNFDALTGQFFQNGNSFGENGQRWNVSGPGIGWEAGSFS